MRRVQVVIEGFKSYKDQTIIEPFSRNINVVGEGLVRWMLAMQTCANIPLSATSKDHHRPLTAR